MKALTNWDRCDYDYGLVESMTTKEREEKNPLQPFKVSKRSKMKKIIFKKRKR